MCPEILLTAVLKLEDKVLGGVTKHVLKETSMGNFYFDSWPLLTLED